MDLVEKKILAVLHRLKDANSFYRSKGCRDLLQIDRDYPGYIVKGKLERDLWIIVVESLIELAKGDVDDDVRNFATKVSPAVLAMRW